MSLHTGVFRGQHPHSKVLSPSDPRMWVDKRENERWIWDEKYAGSMDDLADGYNPIAQNNGLKGGQSLEAHSKLKRYQAIRKQAESSALTGSNKFSAVRRPSSRSHSPPRIHHAFAMRRRPPLPTTSSRSPK